MQIDNIIKIKSNKSHFQRLLICSILSKQLIRLNNYSNSEDNLVLINCFINLGYSVEIYNTYLIVNSKARIKQNHYELDVKSSGFAVRVLPIILAYEEASFKITFDSRLFDRDLDELKNIFSQLGIGINICQDYLEFNGNLNIAKINHIESDAKVSSQYTSALLIVMAFFNEFELTLNNPTSNQYIDLTLSVLEDFGISINNFNYNHFKLDSKKEFNKNIYEIEGDWSGAANMMILSAILGKGTFENLQIDSKQGDSFIYKLLQNIDIRLFNSSSLLIVEKSKPKGFDFDAENYPDLVPALIPLAIYSEAKCIIRNVNRLKFKETNRLDELLSSYKKLNSNIEYNGNDFIIKPSNLIYQELDSKNDHRLAMSFAIAYKLMKPDLQLIPELCVNKSYPFFYEHVKLIEIYE